MTGSRFRVPGNQGATVFIRLYGDVITAQPPGKVERVKLPVITAKGKLTRVGGKGKKLRFAGTSTKGEKVKARLNVKGKKTKITVGGKPAKASDLKKGMACTVTYKGRAPSKIACM